MAKETIELSATVNKPKKLDTAVLLMEEKVSREFGLSIEEVRAKTIKIKNGEVTI